jgi:hypothetical protein
MAQRRQTGLTSLQKLRFRKLDEFFQDLLYSEFSLSLRMNLQRRVKMLFEVVLIVSAKFSDLLL